VPEQIGDYHLSGHLHELARGEAGLGESCRISPR
jgi:hypothetical protein